MVSGLQLQCGERIKYTCTYDKKNIQIQEGSNDVFGYLSIVIHLSVNSSNNNIFNVQLDNQSGRRSDDFHV